MRPERSGLLHRGFTLLLGLVALPAFQASADDWPQWGGPQRDLVWREDGIVRKFPSGGLLPRIWSTPVGEGYAGPAVADGRVFVLDFLRDSDRGGRGGTERVLCLDAETGDVLWQHAYPVQYTVSYPNGPRATPVIDDNRVYTIGALGDMFCFDVASGDILWETGFQKEFGTRLPNWGMAASPLVEGDQLITLVGGQEALVVSFDKRTGQVLWRALDSGAVGYCPPAIFELGGRRQLLVWHPEALVALDPEDGKLQWQIPDRVGAGLTIATPRVVGNRVFVSSFYNGGRMIEVAADGQSAQIVWQGKSDSEISTDTLHCLMSTPVFTGSHIYGIGTYGQLRCLDAHTGERIWETFEATGEGRWWNAFLIPHEDRYFIHNEQGDLIIARLSPEGYEEISRAKLLEPTRRVRRRMTIWSHPAFAMQSVFARNDREIVRVDLRRDE
ncbi:outer membrane biogenesis protein BamB [Maioricimonas rarisocia]|uniref:Outer membrane biogenesis protein BamB n=1 Tax=Maioricimonas rarisocia TaxID=2528026 RepID=A0A517Z1K3_9PLAN|nr:PQQ-binding-like beta-propeller repeat protein [Maioricimonas rarisocia]QDU36360.1 outer membrane biogenesis protein BamB [Maioricimonas rarisocia]